MKLQSVRTFLHVRSGYQNMFILSSKCIGHALTSETHDAGVKTCAINLACITYYICISRLLEEA